MVGHFLHPSRKSRSTSSGTASSQSGNNASVGQGANAVHNAPMQDTVASRYVAHHETPFAGASVAAPVVPPQNLSAEAVAALPPPGTI